jgi:hypothetical protein
MFVIENNDLVKAARGPGYHKYIKRTGSPGNYKYWYKNSSGQVASHEGDENTVRAKSEHAKRLLAGRKLGKHELTNSKIAQITGLPIKRVNAIASNANLRTPEKARALGYSDDELHEAKHEDVTSDEYTQKIARLKELIGERSPRGEAQARPRTRRATPQRGEASSEAAAPTQEASGNTPEPSEPARAAKPEKTPEQRAEKERKQKIREIRERMRSRGNLDLDALEQQASSGSTPNQAPAQDPDDPRNDPRAGLDQDEEQEFDRRQAEEAEVDESDMSDPRNFAPQYEQHSSLTRNGKEAAIFTFQNEEGETRYAVSTEGGEPEGSYTSLETAKRKMEEHVGPRDDSSTREAARRSRRTATASQEVAQEAVERAREVLSSEENQELTAASPELADTDKQIRKMVEMQARGENPYLKRAKEFYGRIKDDITSTAASPERKDSIRNFFAAMDLVGDNVGENAIKSAYMQVRSQTGKGAAWGQAKKDVEGILFHSMDELLGNPPIDVDMERMKRGFGMMQFERLKPFLKPEFTSRLNNGNPPPYPTYDDLQDWPRDAADRPAWANSPTKITKKVPKAFFDSMPRDASGKILNPPKELPLHLTPVWTYYANNMSGSEAYGQRMNPNDMGSDQKLRMPETGDLQNRFRNTLRKFIQVRGENSFVDIPKSDAERKGFRIEDLYRSEDAMNSFLATKIIPMEELMKFIKQDMKKVKKSFTLVVDEALKPLNFKKSFTIEEDVKKSELINRIKSLKGLRFKE